MTDEHPTIDWAYSGESDPLCGTGATATERALGHGSAIVLTVIIVIADRLRESPIGQGWRLIVLVLLAYDIAGGAVVNMLNSCKRYYHSALQPDEGTGEWLVKNPRVFTAIHVQPIIAALLLKGYVVSSIIWYALLQLGVSSVLVAPLYIRRSMATAVTLLAILGNLYFLPLGDGLEWFIPCLFIKMAMGHAVREEPYRPSLEFV